MKPVAYRESQNGKGHQHEKGDDAIHQHQASDSEDDCSNASREEDHVRERCPKLSLIENAMREVDHIRWPPNTKQSPSHTPDIPDTGAHRELTEL